MASEVENYRLSGEAFTISLEQERDSYREKLEHMKMLLRRYEQEIQSNKVRKEGVETVSKLLQESRQENVGLQRKNKKLESAVINLQNRLTTHRLSSSITTEEGELLVPGLSKQYLDNLATENMRLRSLIRTSSKNPEEVERKKQNEKDLLMELEDLKSQRDAALDKAREFDTYLKSTDNDKDLQISLLGDQIQQIQRDYHAREVLCMSLAEESSKLRQQLRDVAITCQQMALRLEDKQSEKPSANTKEKDNDKLVRENQSLREKITEIAEMNRRWQEYNNQREKHIQHLKSIIEDQKTAMKSRAGHMTTEKEQQLVNSKETLERQVRQLEDEKQSIQRELQQTHQELVRLNEEKQVFQNRRTTRMSPVDMEADNDTIEALRTQIQLCTEDFASERKDRESAQSRILQLEAQVEQLKRRKDILPSPEVVPLPMEETFRQATHQNYSPTYMNIPSSYQPQNNLAARGVALDDLNVVDGRNEHLEYDRSPEGKIPKPDSHPDDRSDSFPSLQTIASFSEIECDEKPTETLKCPECNKEYTADRHGELMDHMEFCCN